MSVQKGNNAVTTVNIGTSANWIPIVKALSGALLLVVSICCYASTPTFSLSGQWSNTANPNGPWSYRQGGTLLPLINDWNAAGTAPNCNQPARAPSNNAGDFLPAILKANACTAEYLNTSSKSNDNVELGDIVVHTVDSFNDHPSAGVANILFKLPAGDDGLYQISGTVWDASLYYGTARPQDWVLLVNGVVRASGVLSGDLPRSKAQTFNISVNLTAGQTVELELNRDSRSQAGFFVGTSMTIKPAECLLEDTPTYDETTGILTMKFSLTTVAAATWQGWIADHNALESLWSQSLPITEPLASKTKTHALSKSGEIGVLSTLTTETTGITCSSWVTVNTGAP